MPKQKKIRDNAEQVPAVQVSDEQAPTVSAAGFELPATLSDDLSGILGYPDPAGVRLPIGEVPDDVESAVEFAEALQAQVSMTTGALQLRQVLQEAARADETHAVESELTIIAVEQARLELADARRAEARAEVTAEREARRDALIVAGLELETRARNIEIAELERLAAREAKVRELPLEYTFYDEVTEESIQAALEQLSEWSREEPGRPVSIVLCSPGGNVFDGLALFDFLVHMRSRGHYVTVTVLGMAASMGAVLLQAGDERIIGANAFLMNHELSTGVHGTVTELSDELALSQMMQERLLSILASRASLSKKQIRKRWARRDWWMDSARAVEYGFADRVL
jgi:ATP-dependent Clp endopeptidase proteolytic subunit ClpP